MRRGAWSSMVALAATCLFACGGTKPEVRGGEAGRPPDSGGGAGGPISGGNGGKGGGGSAGLAMMSGPGGASGGGGGGLPPEVVGPAFFVTGCPLYPASPATRAPGELHLGADGLIRGDERDCAYTASDPVTLPLVPGDGGDLLFHFDVNGDAIDDLFFGHLFSTTEIPSPSLVVLESTLSSGALSFTRVACQDTGSIVPHGAFFLRDLNRDGVPDFIAQSGRTVDAWLNLPGTPRSVLHYTFPTNTSGWGAVLDVVIGDFDGDETDDVAMGFDYNGAATSSFLGIEMGTMLFRGRPGLGTYEAPTIIAQSPIGVDTAAVMQSGYIAGVPLASGGAGLIGLTWHATESPGWLFGADTDEWLHAAHLPGREPAFVQYVAMGGPGALVIGGTNEVAVYGLAANQLSLLKAQTTVFRHSIDRELGGGPRFRSMYLLDVEGDGVDDLIEYQRNPDPGRPPQLAIHSRIAETASAAPVVVDLADFYSDLVESPFVAVGAMKGRLVVGNGDDGESTGSPRPATIRALNCAP